VLWEGPPTGRGQARGQCGLDLDDQLLADAKALAAQRHTTLTRVIEDGAGHDRQRMADAAAGRGLGDGRIGQVEGQAGNPLAQPKDLGDGRFHRRVEQEAAMRGAAPEHRVVLS
jgi:hypothetical protein